MTYLSNCCLYPGKLYLGRESGKELQCWAPQTLAWMPGIAHGRLEYQQHRALSQSILREASAKGKGSLFISFLPPPSAQLSSLTSLVPCWEGEQSPGRALKRLMRGNRAEWLRAVRAREQNKEETKWGIVRKVSVCSSHSSVVLGRVLVSAGCHWALPAFSLVEGEPGVTQSSWHTVELHLHLPHRNLLVCAPPSIKSDLKREKKKTRIN